MNITHILLTLLLKVLERKTMAINTDDKREAQASRLKECMKLSGRKQADLIRLTKLRFNIDVKSSHLSMILKAKRSLPDDYAEYFASILDVEYGYLIGSDLFRAESYQDYLEKEKSQKGFKKAIQQMSQYDSLIEPYGYYVKACLADGPEGSNVTTYQIHRNGQMANIPDKEMIQFKKDVDAFIRLKMDALMDRYRFDPEPLMEKYEEALANGEVIDLTDKPDQNGK